ncbi:MAG: DUF4389 domain-containing protein [Kistimonas sp.]|nr:DUF4389 domain-containing protein [Kistimonas sp.]
MSESDASNGSLQERVLCKSVWMRILYMLLFCVAGYVSLNLLLLSVLLQTVMVLVTSQPNQNVHKLTAALTNYLYQIAVFVSFHGDTKPFPFSDCPSCDIGGTGEKGPKGQEESKAGTGKT